MRPMAPISLGNRQSLSYVPPPMGVARPTQNTGMITAPRLNFGNFGIGAVQQSRSYVPPSTQPQQAEEALPTVPFWCGIGEKDGTVEIYGLQEHLSQLKQHPTFKDVPKSQLTYVNPEVGSDFNAEEQVKKELGTPVPGTEPLPPLPQYIMRICFVDPEGIVVWNDRGQLIGSSKSNLVQLRRLQSALGENSKFVLCMSEGVRVSLGEEKFRKVFQEAGVRVDTVLEPKDVQIDVNVAELSVQQFAVEKLKTNRCAEIHAYLDEQIKVPYNFCIIQTWGGKEKFGILDALPVQEMADRVIQPKNFVVDAKDIVMQFVDQMK